MEVKRKPNESIGSLMRRFSRLAQQSHLVINAKKAKHFAKKPNERVEKNRALMREHLRALRKKLERLGKFDDDTFDEEKKKLKQKLGL
jgi:ribosomal protein S21